MPEVNARDLWTLAQTVWGESRGEPKEGQAGVAWTVLNRQRFHRRWQGRTITAICTAHAQFACWLPSDPNYDQLQRLTVTTPGFAACLQIALNVLAGAVPSPIGAATHYYADSIQPPRWAQGQTPLAVIGHHRFFANIA